MIGVSDTACNQSYHHHNKLTNKLPTCKMLHLRHPLTGKFYKSDKKTGCPDH